MSKLQLLYEKLMRIAYIFGAVFFVLSLIDFSIAMMTGAFSCSSGTCGVGDDNPFFQFTLWPLIILTGVFIVTGYVFFKLAHKESDLLSVSDYKKTLDNTNESEEAISREELYEKLKRGNRKQKVQKDPFFKKIWTSVSEFFGSIGKKLKESKENRAKLSSEEKAVEVETQKQEDQRVEKEKLERTRTKLNKTALILYLSKHTDLTQNNSRLFVNSLLDIIKDNVIAGEEVKLSKFGRFEKVHIKEHTETDSVTGAEVKIEKHNTVEFFAYKPLLEKLNDGVEIIEDAKPLEKTKTLEPVQEEIQEEVTPEPVQEEIQEEVTPEPVQEEIQEEVTSEPVQEEIQEEVTPEPVQEEIQKETTPEPVQEEIQEEAAPEPVQEDVKVETKQVKEETKSVEIKPAKPKPSVKTKKQIIELMDETTDLSKNKANKFLKFFAEVVKEQLIKREDVELEGIGFFTTIEMPAKEAVNPQTNEKIVVPAHHQVRLRFDEELKDKMND